MTSIETYLRYGDLFGVASGLDEFQTALKSFDLGTVLRVFAAINVLCSRRGLSQNRSAQLGLIREMFDPQIAKQIEQRGLDVFHRRQCLFVLREAMRFSPDIPDMQLTLESRHKIGLMALMANDHASSTTSIGNSEAETLLARICDFVPVTEANELKFDFASVARIHKIVNDLAPASAGEKNYFDIASQFESAAGLPLRTFEALILAILPRIMFSASDLSKRSAITAFISGILAKLS